MEEYTNRAYNDIEFILENLDEKSRNRIPEKLRTFLHDHRDPDYQSTVSNQIPIENQELSDETLGWLASLSITYWAENDKARRAQMEKMRQNDQTADGKPVTRMTDEEYHQSLEDFSFWNEMFGPIPFWEESMRSHTPLGHERGVFYTILGENERYLMDITAGGTYLRKIFLPEEEAAAVKAEAENWILWENYSEYDEDYAHFKVKSDVSRQTPNPVGCRLSYIVRDGHFYGYAFLATDFTNEGNIRRKEGITLIDGTEDGHLTSNYTHDSGSEEENIQYSYCMKKKEQEDMK